MTMFNNLTDRLRRASQLAKIGDVINDFRGQRPLDPTHVGWFLEFLNPWIALRAGDVKLLNANDADSPLWDILQEKAFMVDNSIKMEALYTQLQSGVLDESSKAFGLELAKSLRHELLQRRYE